MSGPPHAAPLAAAMPSPGAGAVARLPLAPAALSGAADEAGERERLVDAMERAGWVQAKAARLLGLTPRQIGYALKKHDIEIKRF